MSYPCAVQNSFRMWYRAIKLCIPTMYHCPCPRMRWHDSCSDWGAQHSFSLYTTRFSLLLNVERVAHQKSRISNCRTSDHRFTYSIIHQIVSSHIQSGHIRIWVCEDIETGFGEHGHPSSFILYVPPEDRTILFSCFLMHPIRYPFSRIHLTLSTYEYVITVMVTTWIEECLANVIWSTLNCVFSNSSSATHK